MSNERILPGGIALKGDAPYADPDWDQWMNENLFKLSVLFQLKALSRTTSLPGGPTNGDIYIVPDGDPEGNKIAVRDEGAWVYLTPFDGLVAYVADDDEHVIYDGSAWGIHSTGGGGGGGGGAETFLELTDTPSEYTGAAGKLIAVKGDETGAEFIDAPSVPNALTENEQTGTTYTFVLADGDGKFVSTTNASGVTITIPPNGDVAIPIGRSISLWQKGDGQVTVVEGSGVTLANPTGASNKLRAKDSWATLVKTGTDEWSLIGDLETTPGTLADAEDVAYDNTTSGLTAVDIQAAIDELISDVNAFDWHEKGTFTPTMTFDTPGDISVSYSAQVGTYTLIGDRLLFDVLIVATPTYTTASGNLLVTGLPYVRSASGGSAIAVRPQGVTWDGSNVTGGVLAASADIQLFTVSSGGSESPLTTANLPSGQQMILHCAGHYDI